MNNLIGVIGGLGPKATTYFMDLVMPFKTMPFKSDFY